MDAKHQPMSMIMQDVIALSSYEPHNNIKESSRDILQILREKFICGGGLYLELSAKVSLERVLRRSACTTSSASTLFSTSSPPPASSVIVFLQGTKLAITYYYIVQLLQRKTSHQEKTAHVILCEVFPPASQPYLW